MMPIPATRRAVTVVLPRLYDQDPIPVSNAGLELDKYLRQAQAGSGAKTHRTALLSRVCTSIPPDMYTRAFVNMKHGLEEAWGDCLVIAELTTTAPLVVGLGGGSILEAGINLHRLYGMPLIPGSALKGLARSWVRHEHNPNETALEPRDIDNPDAPADPNQHTVLFGDTLDAGDIVWCDAWYVPRNGSRPLWQDVITEHHPGYNRHRGGEAGNPPWDFDDPNPNPFISTRGTFLFAVAGPSLEWAQAAMYILRRALAEYGVGAKTSSGYGRFRDAKETAQDSVPAPEPASAESTASENVRVVAAPQPPPVEPVTPDTATAALRERIDHLRGIKNPRSDEINTIVAELEALTTDQVELTKYFLVAVRNSWNSGPKYRALMRLIHQHEPGWKP